MAFNTGKFTPHTPESLAAHQDMLDRAMMPAGVMVREMVREMLIEDEQDPSQADMLREEMCDGLMDE